MQYTQPGPQRMNAIDDGEFKTLPSVPVFDEHTAPDGTEYGKAELQGIADTMNDMIRRTGDYCPLVAGHRPDHEEKANGVPEPEVLGYSGPYHVANIATDGEPAHWAICAVWRVFAENFDRLKKLARRSVEIWDKDIQGNPLPPKERFFDPIALLGAETPKRHLGLAYKNHGQATRYEMAATPAFASGNNTFVPGLTGKRNKPEKYEQENGPMLSEDDLKQIVEAMKPVIAAVVSEMTAPPEPAEPAPEAAAPVVPEPEAKQNEADEEDEMPPADESKANQYARERDDLATKYAREKSAHKATATKYEAAQARVKELEAANVRAVRYSRLNDLAAEGCHVDVEEEITDCAEMTDTQFDRHLERIGTKYQRTNLGSLPREKAKPHPIAEAGASEKRAAAAEKYCREKGITDFKVGLDAVDKGLVTA